MLYTTEEMDYLLLKEEGINILYNIETADLVKLSPEMYEKLSQNYINKEDRDIMELLNYLKSQDKIKVPVYDNKKYLDKKVLQGIVFSSSTVCNLKCIYCFVDGGTYGNDIHKIMSFNEYKTCIDSLSLCVRIVVV